MREKGEESKLNSRARLRGRRLSVENFEDESVSVGTPSVNKLCSFLQAALEVCHGWNFLQYLYRE